MSELQSGERCPRCGTIIAPPLRGCDVRIDRQECRKCHAVITIRKTWEENPAKT